MTRLLALLALLLLAPEALGWDQLGAAGAGSDICCSGAETADSAAAGGLVVDCCADDACDDCYLRCGCAYTALAASRPHLVLNTFIYVHALGVESPKDLLRIGGIDRPPRQV